MQHNISIKSGNKLLYIAILLYRLNYTSFCLGTVLHSRFKTPA